MDENKEQDVSKMTLQEYKDAIRKRLLESNPAEYVQDLMKNSESIFEESLRDGLTPREAAYGMEMALL